MVRQHSENHDLNAAYRPLSGLAVAGFFISSLFALAVIGVGITALVTGRPLLMAWMLLLAVAGAGLSLAGWIQVRRSEGTRAGLALARWGWWLGLLFGLGYASYLGATELAIRQQSRTFTDSWLRQLAEGDVSSAFVLTLPPALRKGDNPHDLQRLQARYQFGDRGRKGLLPQFQQQELVRLLQQAGSDGVIESQGLEGWQMLGNGYLVRQHYRATTPEGVFAFQLPAWGGESSDPEKEYAGRKWYIHITEPMTVQPQQITPLGEAMQTLRASCARFVHNWGGKLRQGRHLEAYLETRGPAERDLLQAHLVAGLAAASANAGRSLPDCLLALDMLSSSETAALASVPGYRHFLAGDLVQVKELVTANDDARDAIQEGVANLFRPAEPMSWAVLEVPENLNRFDTRWRLEKGVLHMTQPIQIRMDGKYIVEGKAEVVADDPGLALRLGNLLQAAREGKTEVPSLPATLQPDWQLTRIDLLLGFETSAGP